MYCPKHFAETRLPVLHQTMLDIGLAAVTTFIDGPSGSRPGLQANLIPLHLEPSAGPYGTLYGHMAPGSPQIQSIEKELAARAAAMPAEDLGKADPKYSPASIEDVLIIYQGPQAYVSPGWFPDTKPSGGKNVASWNYITIQARGRLRLLTDRPEGLRVLSAQNDYHENKLLVEEQAGLEGQTFWRSEEAPPEYINVMMKQTRVFSVELTSVEGKWKMTQYKPGELGMHMVVDGLNKRAAASEGKDPTVLTQTQLVAKEMEQLPQFVQKPDQ